MVPTGNKSGPIFIGRDDERAFYRANLERVIKDPHTACRTFFVYGPAGIGKTRYLVEMESDTQNTYQGNVRTVFVDLFSTEHRSIDGIQCAIKKLVLEKYGSAPFAEFEKDGKQTMAVFRSCLRELCAQQRLVVIFDTYENVHGDKAGDWILSAEEAGGPQPAGLQVPGLFVLIASRPFSDKTAATQGLDPVKHPNVVQHMLKGFNAQETLQLYERLFPDDPPDDPLRDFCAELAQRTQGDPLLIELTFNWMRSSLWTKGTISALTAAEFEEKLMGTALGQPLFVNGRLSYSAYQTIICMAYMNRRFNQEILSRLVRAKYITDENGDSPSEEKQVEDLERLERLFFVKVRTGAIQLHDKLTELVMKYLWPTYNPVEGTREDLQKFVLDLYDELYLSGDSKDAVHEAERLDYNLRWNAPSGMGRFFDLAERSNLQIDRLLPGEMRRHLEKFFGQDQHEILLRMAEIEQRLGHVNQAEAYWQDVLNAAQSMQDDNRIVRAMLGLFNTIWHVDAKRAEKDYLDPALELAKEKQLTRLADASYEKGWACRSRQEINEAIQWYELARDVAALRDDTRDPSELAIYPTIQNDLGYMYAFIGDYHKAKVYVEDALEERMNIVTDIEKTLARVQSQIQQAEQDNGNLQALHSDENRLQFRKMTAEKAVGLSLNTLGEIHRFMGRPDTAISFHNRAVAIFERLGEWSLQVRARHAAAEAHRLVAVERHEKEDQEGYDRHVRLLIENLDKCLELCEEHQIYEEKDTIFRRYGRILHDQALTATDQQTQRDLLMDAMHYFEQALVVAKKSADAFEELNALNEIAFLADDILQLEGAAIDPETIREKHIAPLERAIANHEKEEYPIMQLEVFKHMRDMELGAYYYRQNDMDRALNYYLNSFTGLASKPGYGISRYLSLRSHLKKQMKQIEDNTIAARWCQAFIDAWDKTLVEGTIITLSAAQPELLEWMKTHLRKRK